MEIDVITEEGINWMRYTSDVVPMVGDVISTIKPERSEFTVLSVEHSIGPRFNLDEMYQERVILTVRKK